MSRRRPIVSVICSVCRRQSELRSDATITHGPDHCELTHHCHRCNATSRLLATTQHLAMIREAGAQIEQRWTVRIPEMDDGARLLGPWEKYEAAQLCIRLLDLDARSLWREFAKGIQS